jgi:hypothetical protein
MILANNRSTKLGTLICSAHARTVRPTGADRPDRGPSGLRAGPSALNLVLNNMLNQFFFKKNVSFLVFIYEISFIIILYFIQTFDITRTKL